MLPNFFDQEYVLTDKFTYKFIRQPQRGEVVIVNYPKNPTFEYIKRVIGLPGDTLKIMGGQIWLKKNGNWEELRESYLAPNIKTFGHTFLSENQEFAVPKDNYLVMGDNREVSSDGREWGLVPKKYLVGRALIRVWPPSKLGAIVNNPTY